MAEDEKPADDLILIGILDLFENMRKSGIRIGIPEDEVQADLCFREFIMLIHTAEDGSMIDGPDEGRTQQWARRLTDAAKAGGQAELYQSQRRDPGFLGSFSTGLVCACAATFAIFSAYSGWIGLANGDFSLSVMSAFGVFMTVLMGHEAISRMSRDDKSGGAQE